MRAAVKRDVRSEERPGTDSDLAGIDDGAVEIDEDVLAELNVRAVVYVDG